MKKDNILSQVFNEMKPVLEDVYEEMRKMLIIPTTQDVDKQLRRIQQKASQSGQ